MIISVANELLAIAEPQPKVLNFASLMTPSSIFTCNLITSPQEAFPTSAVPTSPSSLFKEPTFRGLLKWSCTASWYWRMWIVAKGGAELRAACATSMRLHADIVRKSTISACYLKNQKVGLEGC